MDLLEELEAEVTSAFVGRCPVRRWLLSLDPEQRAKAQQVIDSAHPATAVVESETVRRHFGALPFTVTSLQAHRRGVGGRAGGCKCRS